MRRDFENAAGFVRFGRSVLCAFDLSTAVLVGLLCCCQLVSTGVLASLIHRSRATPLPHHISHDHHGPVPSCLHPRWQTRCFWRGRRDTSCAHVRIFRHVGRQYTRGRGAPASDMMLSSNRSHDRVFERSAILLRIACPHGKARRQSATLLLSGVTLGGLLVSVPSSPSLGYCCRG